VPEAFVTIKRRAGYWADSMRVYKIVLDGEVVVHLDEGDEEIVSTDSGVHTVHVRIDYFRSQKLAIDLQAGEVLKLECWPNARVYNWPFFLIIGWTHYIALRREEPTPVRDN